MFIAHRGLVLNNLKENTLEAFKNACSSHPYAGFELDIYMTQDKQFIVHHDAFLEGKYIKKYTLEELKKKGLTSLEEVLKIDTDKIILIEIKDINIDVSLLAHLLNQYQDKNIYVMSFFTSVIRKLKDQPFKVGVLNYILNSTNYYPFDFIGILYPIANAHIIKELKKLNLEVFIYGLTKKDKYIYKDVYYIVDTITAS